MSQFQAELLDHFDQRVAASTRAIRDMRNLLLSSTTFARQCFRATEAGGGWRQFLLEDGDPSVTGTACVSRAVIATGESPFEPDLTAARRFLTVSRRPDGGWSKPGLDGHTSLTLLTCLAVLALTDMGAETDDVVGGAASWLAAAQNNDGGWGQLPRDERSDTTSTAMSIRALACARRTGDYARTQERAVAWLHLAGPEQCWGRTTLQPGAEQSATVAHTSHAIEALLAIGARPASLAAGARCIEEHLPVGLVPWVEQYSLTTSPVPPEVRSERLSWTHLPAERALIALLRLGKDPTADPVTRLSRDIILRNPDSTYWRIPTISSSAPSWAMMEAVASLSLYADRLTEGAATAAIRDALRRIGDLSEDLRRELDDHTRRIGAVEERVRPSRVAQLAGTTKRAVLWNTYILGAIVTALLMTAWFVSGSGRELFVVALSGVPVAAAVAGFVVRRRRSTPASRQDT